MSKKKNSVKIKKHGKPQAPKNEALNPLPNVKVPTAPVVPKVSTPVINIPTIQLPKVTTPKSKEIKDNEYILVDISFGATEEVVLRSGTRRYYKWMSAKHPHQVILQKENLDLTLSIGDKVKAVETGVFAGKSVIYKTEIVEKNFIDMSVINGLNNIEEQPGMTLLFPNEVAVLILKSEPVPSLKGWVGTKLAY